MSIRWVVCRLQPIDFPLYEPVEEFDDRAEADDRAREFVTKYRDTAESCQDARWWRNVEFRAVPLDPDEGPRRYLTRWNRWPFEGTQRWQHEPLDGLYDAGLFWDRPSDDGVGTRPRVRPGDHMYVVHGEPGRLHLICRFEVEWIDPEPVRVHGEGGRRHLTWEAGGTSEPMSFRRWIEPIAAGRRLLFWRQSVYRKDRDDGYWNHPDDLLPPPWRNVEGRRFLRPGVVQRRADGALYLGQTIRHLSEIGVGFSWLDQLLGLSPHDLHPSFKEFIPKGGVAR